MKNMIITIIKRIILKRNMIFSNFYRQTKIEYIARSDKSCIMEG